MFTAKAVAGLRPVIERAASEQWAAATAGGDPELIVDYAQPFSITVICALLGVPVESQALRGQDSLLSIVQMPAGIPVGTLAIGRAGAVNAGLLAAAILATTDPALADRLDALRAEQTAAVAETPA